MSAALDTAIARMKSRQPASWIAAENAVSRFLAELAEGSRVLCRGTVRTPLRDLPAALICNSKTGDVYAVAADDPPDGITVYPACWFWSNVPYESIAREVLAGPEETAA
jgi:hypothetical protein